jgi:hypothetical protein
VGDDLRDSTGATPDVSEYLGEEILDVGDHGENTIFPEL